MWIIAAFNKLGIVHRSIPLCLLFGGNIVQLHWHWQSYETESPAIGSTYFCCLGAQVWITGVDDQRAHLS